MSDRTGPDRPGGEGLESTYGPVWSASWARAGEDQLEAWLAFAQAACDAADEIALRHFRRELDVMVKPDRTFVTIADRAIETTIRERITAAFPDHGIVGEEHGDTAPEAMIRWYIDPIDGTANFVRGVPVFATLLALEKDGELQVGVVSAPALGERWYARRGGGAWAASTWGARAESVRRVLVSGVDKTENAHVLYGSALDVEESGQAPGFTALLRDAWRDRGFGDFWGYALVADGSAESMIESDLSAYDLAAPAILVEEAGGLITDLSGRRTIHGGSALATNGILHETMLERLHLRT
jgi:histidinol-phosphatase